MEVNKYQHILFHCCAGIAIETVTSLRADKIRKKVLDNFKYIRVFYLGTEFRKI
jgi:hypothetical protein